MRLTDPAATREETIAETVAEIAEMTADLVVTAVRAVIAETTLPQSAVLLREPPEPLLLKKEEQTNVNA